MPATASPPMTTVGVIARRLGEPVSRITYVLRTRDIRPLGTAGIAKVYDDEVVEIVADELRRIDAARDRAEAIR